MSSKTTVVLHKLKEALDKDKDIKELAKEEKFDELSTKVFDGKISSRRLSRLYSDRVDSGKFSNGKWTPAQVDKLFLSVKKMLRTKEKTIKVIADVVAPIDQNDLSMQDLYLRSEISEHLSERYGEISWDEISKLVGGRTAICCYNKYRYEMFYKDNKPEEFTEEELEILGDAVKKYGKDPIKFDEVSEVVFGGNKSAADLRTIYEKKIRKDANSAKWKQFEIDLLLKTVEKHKSAPNFSGKISWEEIQKTFAERDILNLKNTYTYHSKLARKNAEHAEKEREEEEEEEEE